MKKYICLLIVFVLSLGLFGCKKPPTDSEEPEKYHYDFKKQSDIEKDFNIYRMIVDFGDEKFEFMVNDKAFYFESSDLKLLYNKEEETCYKVDSAKEELYVVQEDISLKFLSDTCYSYLIAHYDINDSYYKKKDGTVKIGDFECEEYDYVVEESKNKVVGSYFVSTEYGVCIKRSLISYENNIVKDKAEWVISLISFDEKFINIEMDSYLKYDIGDEYIMFDKWPTKGYGTLIPEFREGSFVTATQNSVECNIYLKAITSSSFDNYVEKLKLYGFSCEKYFTNEIGQVVLGAYLIENEECYGLYGKLDVDNSLYLRIYKTTIDDVKADIENYR